MTIPRDAIVGGLSEMGEAAAGLLTNDPLGFISQGARMFGGVPGRQGIISNSKLGIFIVFQKNPETITEETQNTYTFTTIQGQANPLMSFSGRGAKHKRFDILIDAHATPHPFGHVGRDLDAIEMLTIPYDKAGKPLVRPAQRGITFLRNNTVSNEAQGIPPVVKIVHGGRAQRGFIVNLSIEEIMHGSTVQSYALTLPTRAKVSFDFVIIDDMRMLVSSQEVVA